MKYNFDEVINRKNTNSVKYDLLREQFGTDDMIPMWVADMDFRTPDFIMQAIRERARHEILGYSIRADSFYDAIINWYRRRQNWNIKKEWIVFSPGIVPALYLAIRSFSNEGDKIIIQPPVYPPFFSVIQGTGREILQNPLTFANGRYSMDLDDLERKIDDRTKLILLSHPHNPVGRVWTTDELTNLAELCKEKRIIIISDEIHSDLVYKPFTHIPLSSVSDEIADHTITCVAPSKTFNIAGLSSSAIIIPNQKLREKFNHELETSHLWLGNIFGTVALEASFNKGDDWLDQLMDYLKGNLDLIVQYISQQIPQIKVIIPEATYLVWLDMRELGLSDAELREFMTRKAKVGCNHGPTFGSGGEGFQRMNFACPGSTLKKALQRLKEAVAELAV